VKFDQVKKKSFDQTPNLTETFDQLKRSSEIRSTFIKGNLFGGKVSKETISSISRIIVCNLNLDICFGQLLRKIVKF
jgi:hypothetical protein